MLTHLETHETFSWGILMTLCLHHLDVVLLLGTDAK